MSEMASSVTASACSIHSCLTCPESTLAVMAQSCRHNQPLRKEQEEEECGGVGWTCPWGYFGGRTPYPWVAKTQWRWRWRERRNRFFFSPRGVEHFMIDYDYWLHQCTLQSKPLDYKIYGTTCKERCTKAFSFFPFYYSISYFVRTKRYLLLWLHF